MIKRNFQTLTSTFTPTIFTRSFYCDFPKIIKHSFAIKVQLNILNSLLWEKNIENNFFKIIREYPETREILPILLAVRWKFGLILDLQTKEIFQSDFLFDIKNNLNKNWEKELLKFFRESWLKEIFQNKNISNLNDYVFWIEAGLDSNARKNRSWTLMENLVEWFIKDFCQTKKFQYKDQATAKWILENWKVQIESDKSNRRFDFAIFNWKKVFLIETNFYGWWGSKLKAVAWEFSGLYPFLQKQGINLIWVTDWLGWQTTLRSLEEAYNATDGNIFNLSMLKNWILNEIIK